MKKHGMKNNVGKVEGIRLNERKHMKVIPKREKTITGWKVQIIGQYARARREN